MDKAKTDWSWMPAHMPGVVRLVASKKTELGAAWVNECWKRGVLRGEAGWFYAWEGALAVGTPFDLEALTILAKQAGPERKPMLFIRLPSQQGGTDAQS